VMVDTPARSATSARVGMPRVRELLCVGDFIAKGLSSAGIAG
jgi:hypothetical protein